MYVGAWQEYKLMKVIGDLRDENKKLQSDIAATEANYQNQTDRGGLPATPTERTAFSSSLPWRATATHTSTAAITPRRPSTDGGGGGTMTRQSAEPSSFQQQASPRREATAETRAHICFDQYPPGHPLSTHYRTCYGQALPSPSLGRHDSSLSQQQQQQQSRVHHRASGAGPSTSNTTTGDAPARLPFRMYWRPDEYGRYSIDNHEGAAAQQQHQRQLAAHGGEASSRHCAGCAHKREASDTARRGQSAARPAGEDATALTAPTSTSAIREASRRQTPSVWAKSHAERSATGAESDAYTHYNNNTSHIGTENGVITAMAPPSYGPGEEAILASLGLPRASPQRRVADGSAGDAVPRLFEHPFVNDLARRLPLDTSSLSQLAGQKVYQRCVQQTQAGDRGGGGAKTTDDVRTAQTSGSGNGVRSSSRRPPASPNESARQVERRLRLQALYSGMAPEAVDAYVREQQALRHGKPRGHGPDSRASTHKSDADGADNEDASSAELSGEHAGATPHDAGARGVPWDDLPGPQSSAGGVAPTSPPAAWTQSPSMHTTVDTERVTVPPRAHAYTTLDDILGGGGEGGGANGTRAGQHVTAWPGLQVPPPRQEIEDGDVGGLLDWAANLDMDMIDAM